MQLTGLAVVENIGTTEVDVRARQMDFHIDVVRGRSRIDENDRLVVRIVDVPADAVCADGVGLGDSTLDSGGARYCREVKYIQAVRKIRDRIEITNARL